MFESWRGRYADSPRALSERLRDRYPQLRHIWVADDDASMPDHLERVRHNGPAYFARLLTTDFLVTNDIVSKHLVKGPRVTYVQTWHGTPLKTIGYDEVTPQYAGAASHRKRMARDVAKWDHLLSPSPDCSRIFRSAFGFDGDIVESGYPRNDILRSPEANAIGTRVRKALGVAANARVVLYAPTWRDDARDDAGFKDPGRLELHTFLAGTPEDTLLLVRMHKVVATRVPRHHTGRVIDVSEHPEISELYLASDLLVSDYSSAVYDFAVTGKPIVLFAYDLEHYRTGLRHLYFDYETWAPGPIVDNTTELAAVVSALLTDPSAPGEFTDSYQRFIERFCPFEDGGASDRVIDSVFAPILED